MSLSVKLKLFNHNSDLFLFSLIFCSSFVFLYLGGDNSKPVVVFDSKQINIKIIINKYCFYSVSIFFFELTVTHPKIFYAYTPICDNIPAIIKGLTV
jgi:hypothetical protein